MTISFYKNRFINCTFNRLFQFLSLRLFQFLCCVFLLNSIDNLIKSHLFIHSKRYRVSPKYLNILHGKNPDLIPHTLLHLEITFLGASLCILLIQVFLPWGKQYMWDQIWILTFLMDKWRKLQKMMMGILTVILLNNFVNR